jgi:sec-independent protein translocase protein TatA
MITPPGPWEWMLILAILVLVFGAKRLPEIGRGMGKGIREFKKSLREISSDDNDDNTPVEKGE